MGYSGTGGSEHRDVSHLPQVSLLHDRATVRDAQLHEGIHILHELCGSNFNAKIKIINIRLEAAAQSYIPA